MAFGKTNYPPLTDADIKIGKLISYHGVFAKITAEKGGCVKLEFFLNSEGVKMGTDGWYDPEKLKKDKKVYSAHEAL